MMCINKNHAEYQTLLKLSGLPDFILAAFCGNFLEKHDRFPYLDELPSPNSKLYLTELLELKDGGTKIDKILNFTGTQSVEEALVVINNTYRDLETRIMPLTNEAFVYITPRPTAKPVESVEKDSVLESKLLFLNIIDKLQNVYGIQVNLVTLEDINNSEFGNIPGFTNANAFIYNNEIYVNTDFADKDAPVHEMMHLLMAGVRLDNPDLYFDVVGKMVDTDIFKSYVLQFPGRTLSDLAEECFVTEFSKLISGVKSELGELPNKVQYELEYGAKRILDSILMGQSTVKAYDNRDVFNASLSELCDIVGSTADVKEVNWNTNHRMLNNKKSEMLKSKELIEQCNG